MMGRSIWRIVVSGVPAVISLVAGVLSHTWARREAAPPHVAIALGIVVALAISLWTLAFRLGYRIAPPATSSNTGGDRPQVPFRQFVLVWLGFMLAGVLALHWFSGTPSPR
jgi:hypothetical protein